MLKDKHSVPPKCPNIQSALFENNVESKKNGDDTIPCFCGTIDDESKDAKQDEYFVYRTTKVELQGTPCLL